MEDDDGECSRPRPSFVLVGLSFPQLMSVTKLKHVSLKTFHKLDNPISLLKGLFNAEEILKSQKRKKLSEIFFEEVKYLGMAPVTQSQSEDGSHD